MKRGNCLIFAILMRLALGGRVRSEPSKYGWWRHYWWESACGKWRAEFNPPVKRKRLLPPPIFRGRVTLWFRGSVMAPDGSRRSAGAFPDEIYQPRYGASNHPDRSVSGVADDGHA